MLTDDNTFDKKLKTNLFLDLGFRFGLWLLVSLAIASIALGRGESLLNHFDRMQSSLAPLANTFGTFSLLLCVLALLLKDVEHTTTSDRVRKATHGMLGGFVRRAAGDLSLWLLAALSSLLSTFVLAVASAPVSPSEYGVVAYLGVFLVLLAGFTAIANVYVRRGGPTPLVKYVKDAKWVALAWAGMLAVLVLNLLWGAR